MPRAPPRPRARPPRSIAGLPHLAGAVVAIGNAPTALFRLLELIDAGAPPPALIIGLPVGFIGAAEAKDALIAHPAGVPYIALARPARRQRLRRRRRQRAGGQVRRRVRPVKKRSGVLREMPPPGSASSASAMTGLTGLSSGR